MLDLENSHHVFSVNDINVLIKDIFDSTYFLRDILVQGEISNYKKHTSGHHYFSLKDKESVISAVMFKFDSYNLKTKLENGMMVIAGGRISSFVKSGQYQLYVTSITENGLGALHLEFERLKRRLFEEGLFDDIHKKTLPKFPEKVCLVTSKTGAVVSDMSTIIKNRYPLCEIIVYPVIVQGRDAAQSISNALHDINKKKLCDVCIVGRGGGSIEDLWAFNEECVAMAVFESRIPVISAVGHEPDVTICDFVADARAATPSNAAEIVVPDINDVKDMISNYVTVMAFALKSNMELCKSRAKELAQRLNSHTPQRYMKDKMLIIDFYTKNITTLVLDNLSKDRQRFIKACTYLDGFSPFKVLKRGYSVASDMDGNVLLDASRVCAGDGIRVKLHRGEINCTVGETKIELKD